MQNLLSVFKKVDKIAGVEVSFAQKEVEINVAVISKSKQTLKIEKTESCVKQIESAFDSTVPVVLTFTGKGILSRIVKVKSDKPEDFLFEIFPDANSQDFYTDSLEIKSGTFLSVARKEIIDGVLSDFKSKGVYIVGYSLGVSCITSLLPFLDEKTVELASYRVTVDSEGEFIFEQNKELNEKKYLIGGDEFSTNFLHAVGAVFNFYLPNPLKNVSKIEVIEQDKENLKQKKFFYKIVVLVSLILGSLVFINLLLFLSFSSANKELSMANSKGLQEFKELVELKRKVAEKEKFLGEAGWLNSSRTSFYADRIASTIPESVDLTELSINPIDVEAVRKEKTLFFEQNLIVLKGNCKSPVVLNPWIKTLKQFEWVKDVNNKKYYFDHKKHEGVFEIEVIVNVE